MSRPNENVLRHNSSKKPIIITFVIMIFVLSLLVSYGYYCVLNYEYKNPNSSMELADYFLAISTMSSPDFSLPFSVEVLGEIVRFQASIWWLYLALIAIIFIYMTSRSRNDFKNMEHGSARWANETEIARFQQTKKEIKKKVEPKGIPLAKDTYLALESKYAANLNELVIGGSGAGKTFRKIKPDILQMSGSYVITDPKGELYRDCAKVLKEAGYKIKVLNLVNLHYSNSYNPFTYITSEQDVVNVANLFMKNTAGDGEKEDFFTGAAQKLLIALMLYLYKSENEIKTFGRVIRLLNSIRYKNGSIDLSCELARCFNRHATEYPNDAATINWSGMQANAQETQSSINEVLSTRLSLWSTTDLDAITSTDEMDFDSIGKEKTAIFLILPAARNTYKVVCNLFYSQLFERLMRVAEEKYNGRLPNLVSCELDEFANIGEVPNFNETLSVVRSYNIRICIVVQGLSQLKAIYEKTYDSIIGNCDIFTMLGSKDKDTLDYISDKLGKITARNDSRSYNRGGMQGGGGQDTEASGERPLLYPDEIKEAIKPKGKNRKYGGNSIVFVGYEKPMFLPKFDTANHPLFSKCGSQYEEYSHNNTYASAEYAEVWKNRLVKYKEMYDKHFSYEEDNKKEYESKKIVADAKLNKELEEEFLANNPIVPPSPKDLTESEYAEYTNSADRINYEPVPDFDDSEPDEILDEVAPIVEILKMIGDS